MTHTPERLALIVDPDADSRDAYGTILTPMAPAIEYAEDGRQALAIAIGHPPRFVITETRLAFIDGYTLCSLLRSDPLTADVPIVILTGDTSPGDLKRARGAGADSVLIKPCDSFALVQAVALGRERSWPSEDGLHAQPGHLPSQRVQSDSTAGPPTQHSRFLVRDHQRYETSAPPIAPPPLRCPSCDHALEYVRSYVGGVSAHFSEQWDYYTCHSACGMFQYRQRTRRLRMVR
jgi:CheY-like chemotaxis protein